MAHSDWPQSADQRRVRREDRRDLLRRLERDQAGAQLFRVTLAGARARWPQWEAEHNARRRRGFLDASDRFNPVVAKLLVAIHLPELPPSTEVVAYALRLECGHEEFWLVHGGEQRPSPPTQARCPVFWSCPLSGGRTAVRYIQPAQPTPKFAGSGLTRRAATLACGHETTVWTADTDQSRLGDCVVCQACGPDDPDSDVEIVAEGETLPDLMVQDWQVELNCGHVGTDYCVPVEFRDDPAAYRANDQRLTALVCLNEECAQRTVRGVRRLGTLGQLDSLPTPRLDPVDVAARDMRRRLTREERQALARRLQEED